MVLALPVCLFRFGVQEAGEAEATAAKRRRWDDVGERTGTGLSSFTFNPLSANEDSRERSQPEHGEAPGPA